MKLIVRAIVSSTYMMPQAQAQEVENFEGEITGVIGPLPRTLEYFQKCKRDWQRQLSLIGVNRERDISLRAV